MKTATFRLVFNRKKKIMKPDEKLALQIEVYHDSVRRYYSTGVLLKNEEWNKSTKRVMKRTDAVQLNKYIYDLISDYESYQSNRLKNGLEFSHDEFAEYLRSGASKQEFTDFMEKEIEARQDIMQATKDAHHTVLERIRKFGCIKGFQDLTYEIIQKFDYWLRTNNYAEESIATSHAQFKSYINRALKLGKTETNPYSQFEIKEPNRTTRKFLTIEEVKKIEEKEFDIPRVDHVRDIFIFSCYTGLAYGDLNILTSDHLVEEDGVYWIRKNRDKTDNRISIPLLPKAREIIEKYKGKLPGNKVLPVLSNQKMNSYLKEVGDLCGIRMSLTMHVARHTFATTITLSNGVPLETVSKLLSHSSIKTTQIYAKIVDSKVKSDMDQLKGKIS